MSVWVYLENSERLSKKKGIPSKTDEKIGVGSVLDGRGLGCTLKERGGRSYSSSVRSILFFLPLLLRDELVVATLDLLDDVRLR